MGKADVSLKGYLSNKERFADLFNGYLFEGVQIISPHELVEMNNESNVILPDKMGKKREVTRFGDIRMKWQNEVEFAILTTEFQDMVHYAMPVKSMILDSLCYIDQIRNIWRNIDSMEEKRKLGIGEIFSRFRKEDKLCPVIPMVFYYGDNWDGCLSLHDMFYENVIIPKKTYKTILSKYVPNYTINLFNPSKISDYSIFKTDLQIIFGMLQYREDKNALRKYIFDNEDFFSNMEYDAALATGTMLRSNTWFDKALQKYSNDKEACDMCKAIDDMMMDSRMEGKIEGKIEGMILAYHELGISPEIISTKMNLSIEDVKKILSTVTNI